MTTGCTQLITPEICSPQFCLPMSTLAEIESAVTVLPAPEKARLLLLVAAQLRAEGALPEPRLFPVEQIEAWMDEDEEDMRKFLAGQ